MQLIFTSYFRFNKRLILYSYLVLSVWLVIKVEKSLLSAVVKQLKGERLYIWSRWTRMWIIFFATILSFLEKDFSVLAQLFKSKKSSLLSTFVNTANSQSFRTRICTSLFSAVISCPEMT